MECYSSQLERTAPVHRVHLFTVRFGFVKPLERMTTLPQWLARKVAFRLDCLDPEPVKRKYHLNSLMAEGKRGKVLVAVLVTLYRARGCGR